MPQVQIDPIINPEFIAKEANLGNNWGTYVDTQNNKQLTYMSYNTDAVELAITNFPTSYLDYLKIQKLEELAAVRKTKEVWGPNGLYLDDKTISRLTAAAVGLLIDQARESVRWEMSRGTFMILPRNTVLGLAVASVDHVQACFDTVYDKTQLIQAITLTANTLAALETATTNLNAIDLTTGWP